MVAMASASRTAASRSTWRGVGPSRAGDPAASAVDSAAEATPKPRLHDPRALVASAAASAGATLVAAMASVEDSKGAAAAAVASAAATAVSGVVALVVVAGIVALVPRTATALLLTHPQVLATAAAVAATVTETATVAMVVGMTEVAAHMMTDRADVMVEAGSATATDEAAAAAAALAVPMPTTSPSAEAGSTATTTVPARTTAENEDTKEATKTPGSCVGTNLASLVGGHLGARALCAPCLGGGYLLSSHISPLHPRSIRVRLSFSLSSPRVSKGKKTAPEQL